MDKMEITTTYILRHCMLILILCYGVSATCSKKAIVDKATKTVTFHSLPIRDTSTNLSLTYDSQGLGPLFNLANSFMDTVQPKNFGEAFKGEDLKIEKFKDWKWVVKKYEIPIAICIGIGLLFAIFMPIVGFCFCCCRCCGKCGGDMKQSEKKSSQHCKAAFMVFLLTVFTIMMLCGTLFMFVTNNRIKDGYDGIVKTTNSAIDEVMKMADNARLDVHQLANDQAQCVTNLLRVNINDKALTDRIGIPLRDHVNSNVSKVLTDAKRTSKKIDNIVVLLQDVVDKNDTFMKNIDHFKSNVSTIKQDLDAAVTRCKLNASLSSVCTELEHINLDVKMDFDNIPNLAEHIKEMKDVQNLNLAHNIDEGNKTINDIPATVITRAESSINDVRKFLNDTESKIQSEARKVTDQIKKETDKIKKDIDKNTMYRDFKRGENDQIERIRWKVYIALSALMAFIVFILLCGLTCGSCGYNKDYMPTERTTTSNCGGNCLMAAVGLMFIFSFILMIFCVVWFAAGIHVHLVCRELKDGEFADTMMTLVMKNKPNVSVKAILGNCRKNVGLYSSTPYIEEKFNISEQIKMDQMEEIQKKINDGLKFDLKDQKLLTDDAKKALEDLTASKSSHVNFTKFFDILNGQLTTTDLNVVIANLTNIYNALKTNSPALAADVKKVADDTQSMKDITAVHLKSNINGMKTSATQLQSGINGITTEGRDLLKYLQSSQTFLQIDTVLFITNKITDLASELLGFATQGVTHLMNEVKTNAARCKPVANIYDGVVNTFMCHNLVQNSNGFWLAMGWCLLFFIPSIILSVKLAKYFRKMEYTAGMDTIVVDHPPFNDKLPPHHDMRPPPPYTSTQHSNPGYQHV